MVLVEGAGALIRRARRAALLERVQAELATDVPVEGTLDEFHARTFSVYRPAVFRGGCRTLAAASWTFAGLRERFADVEITVSGKPMTVAAAIDAMLQPDAPPALYAISQDRLLAGPLQQLRADLAPLPPFLAADATATANLWMGPASTRSPLHHDTTCVWFCQLVGRKRYELVAPWYRAALDADIVDGWDSKLDLHATICRELVLEPGDALYIPTGWWHQVTSLDPAISVSFRAFRWPTEHSWYAPGRL
jgi:hypothetical protein